MILDIDVSTLVPPGLLAPLSQEAALAVLRDIAEAARAKWISLANERLTRTSQDYVNAIQAVDVGDNVASVTLLGEWPNMLEKGFGPFDMRDTLLGPKVPVVPWGSGAKGKHQSKGGGYYRSIFFRHGSERSTGRNAQRVTDTYASQFGVESAKKIGREAWREMKRQLGTPSKSNPGEKTKYGARLETAGTKLADHVGRSHRLEKDANGRNVLVRHGGREHTDSIFAGAMKMKQTYRRASQAYYGTFRTISSKNPDGWIHPGYNGAHLVREVDEYIRRVAPEMMQAALKAASAGGP